MVFAEPRDHMEFLRQAPELFVRSDTHLVELWFSVPRNGQRTRSTIRQVDPVRQWKLSPMDLAPLDKWDSCTEAKEAMFIDTDTVAAPWTVIKSIHKKPRLEAMRHVLRLFDYPGKDLDVATEPDRLIVGPAAEVFEFGERPGRFPARSGRHPRA